MILFSLRFLYIINRNMVPYIFSFKFENVLWFYAILYSCFLILPCTILFFFFKFLFLWYEHKGISKFCIFTVFPQKVFPFNIIILFMFNPLILHVSHFHLFSKCFLSSVFMLHLPCGTCKMFVCN